MRSPHDPAAKTPHAAILFAHGAGAGSRSPWMTHWAARLNAYGSVHPFDYPYMAMGRKRPDPLTSLVAAHRAALDVVRSSVAGPVVLAGKSMGSRVACHVSLERSVAAIVCFGYPLISADGKRERADVLLALRTPVLLIQGTRDRLCPLERLEAVLSRMQATHRLHRVEGGDHSLMVGQRTLRKRAITQLDVDRSIDVVIADFLAEHAGCADGS